MIPAQVQLVPTTALASFDPAVSDPKCPTCKMTVRMTRKTVIIRELTAEELSRFEAAANRKRRRAQDGGEDEDEAVRQRARAAEAARPGEVAAEFQRRILDDERARQAASAAAQRARQRLFVRARRVAERTLAVLLTTVDPMSVMSP